MIKKLEHRPDKLNKDKIYLIDYHILYSRNNRRLRIFYTGGRKKKWREYTSGDPYRDSYILQPRTVYEILFEDVRHIQDVVYELDSFEEVEKLILAWELEK